jgi:ABC-type Fe3+-hydroxamate transport system substrate-binding protein
VGVTDIHNFEQALQMISDVGAVTGKNSEAAQLVKQLTQERELCRSKEQQQRSTLYLIWKDPYMAAGTDTFIHDMMMMAGFKNVVSLSRYPLIHADELIALNPEVVILSSEPYPFSEKHVAELQQILPQSKILLADGELFSWYGSRLLRSFAYFSALHEQIH